MPDAAVELAAHAAAAEQVLQVGGGLPHGEPLLRQGEIRPGVGPAVHAPGHLAAEVVGRDARVGLQGV